MNISAFIGSTMKIKNAPSAQPRNAPKIGISAVNAIKIHTSSAYGSRKIVMANTNMLPRITASRHCPVRKLENVL